jgi:hypothetical protein
MNIKIYGNSMPNEQLPVALSQATDIKFNIFSRRVQDTWLGEHEIVIQSLAGKA